MLLTCKRLRGDCAALELSAIGGDEPPVSPAEPVGGQIEISAPVGINGRNLPADTVTIQDALNRVPLDQGGAKPPLDVDGKCGPKTKGAIQAFQIKHFGWKGADGLVEPNRQTIAKLNEILGTSGVVGKAAPGAAAPAPLVLPDLTASFARALQLVRAAQHNLFAASPVLERSGRSTGPFDVFGREFKMRALNKHFEIDTFPDKRRTFNIILNVYDRMRQVFQRPGGLWGPATFEPDPVNDPNLAYTNFAGFFKGGQFRFHRGKRIRLDTIYVCLGFTQLKTVDEQALVHIHELAHFVGNPEFIGDHAYNFQESGAKLRRLPPNLKVLTAESYSNFAWEASHPGTPVPI
jgi:hypothetical protein